MQNSANYIRDSKTATQLTIVLCAIYDAQTMQNFLRDVMTEKEIIEISARLEAAKMLQANKKYTEITQKTKLSSRTIARISDWMQNGSKGYEAALKIVNSRDTHMQPAQAG